MNYQFIKRSLIGLAVGAAACCLPCIPGQSYPGQTSQAENANTLPNTSREISTISALYQAWQYAVIDTMLDVALVALEKDNNKLISECTGILNRHPNMLPTTRSKLENAIRFAQYQNGTAIDEYAYQRKLRTAAKRCDYRLQQLYSEFNTEIRPRLLDLAHKDPDSAFQLSKSFQNRLDITIAKFIPQGNLEQYRALFNNLDRDILQIKAQTQVQQ